MASGRLGFEEAVSILDRGGVLLLPTDTLPGLHCRADRPAGVERVAGLKGRDDGKPLLVLAGSWGQTQGVCGPLTALQERVCRACWPGPFSLILPAGGLLARRVTAGGTTVAVRVPRHPQLQRLILGVGFPLVSTSANLQGQPPCTELEEAMALFGPKVDGCWQPADGPAAGTRPSALVDLSGPAPRVLRPGPLPLPDQG